MEREGERWREGGGRRDGRRWRERWERGEGRWREGKVEGGMDESVG